MVSFSASAGDEDIEFVRYYAAGTTSERAMFSTPKVCSNMGELVSRMELGERRQTVERFQTVRF
jgi:hypothetical protein